MATNANLPRCGHHRRLPQHDHIPTDLHCALFTASAMPIGSPRQRPALLNP